MCASVNRLSNKMNGLFRRLVFLLLISTVLFNGRFDLLSYTKECI